MDYPVDLASLCGTPRVVPIGGADYRVAPFRPLDLAALQAWIKDRVPHPLDALRPSLAGLDPAARRAALAEARRAATAWPPGADDEAGATLLLSDVEGLALFLVRALRRHRPRVGLLGALELEARLDEATFLRIVDRVYDRDGRAPDAAPRPGKGRVAVGWGEIFERVRKLTGWTYRTIARTPLPAIECVLTGGYRRRGRAFRGQADVDAAVAGWRNGEVG